MKTVVPSLALCVVYLLLGGLPSLYLAALCAAFFPSNFWAAFAPEVSDPAEAMFAALFLGLGILGTVSGWLAFFGLGVNSRIGLVLNSIAISGGIVAAVFFLFILPRIPPSAFLMAVGPILVGVCLLFHLWRAAQPINPPDAAR